MAIMPATSKVKNWAGFCPVSQSLAMVSQPSLIFACKARSECVFNGYHLNHSGRLRSYPQMLDFVGKPCQERTLVWTLVGR